MSKFYITTTLPYVNAEPHVGFALEIIQADAVARYKRMQGAEVFFNFGVDEHGLKIYRKALEVGKNPQEYCNGYAAKFDALKRGLNLSYTNFIRTTDKHHVKAAQEFWKRCLKSGDIYKKNYKIRYCVGCELEKTDSDLENGRCPFHPNQEIEVYDEENYFFRFSKYQQPLLDFYEKNPDFVVPAAKFNEIKAFVASGLEDFSVSRLKKKMPWGIDVPDDPEHIMFVWFDALINYISALGWPENIKKFNQWWPGFQVAGKDNLRQQTAIWQAMLMSAGLPNSKQVFIHGFITIDGQKISKSLGNVINPLELAEKYGTDTLRYYLLSKIHPWEDSDFTIQKFEETYNADLAKGLGNLVARVLKMVENYCGNKVPKVSQDLDSHPLRIDENIYNWKKAWLDLDKNMAEYRFNDALAAVWRFISEADKYIDQKKPWQMAKEGKQDELNWVLYGLLDSLHQIAWQIYPFLPGAALRLAKAMQIKKLLTKNPLNKDSWTNIKPGTKLKNPGPLFPKIEN